MSSSRLQLKVIVLGDSGVGKTSILNRFVKQEFSQSYRATVGADFLFKEFTVDGKELSLQLWDTAGQERFQALGNAFYRGTDCCLLVFDITNGDSFENIVSWKQEFLERSGNENTNFPIILLGNKCDLLAERKVSKEKAKEWADENKIIFDEISAKEDIRVEDAFIKAARLCMSREEYVRPSLPVKPLVLKPPVADTKKKSGCC
jgi:Ras-related protein Rab-7A